MWVSYIYDPLVLIETLLTVLISFYDGLSLVNVTEIYTKYGYTTENLMIQRASTPMTFIQAQEYCLGARMDMFEPRAEMELIKLMREMEATDIWTPLYIHRTAGILVNNEVEIPISAVRDSIIELPASTLISDLGNSKGIILSINALNQTSYAVSLKTTQHSALCIAELPYPYDKHARDTLLSLKSSNLDGMYEMKWKSKKVKRRVGRKLLTLPQVGTLDDFKSKMEKHNRSTDMTDPKFHYDPQTLLLARISRDLEPLINLTIKNWKNISRSGDLIHTENQYRKFEQLYYNILEEVQEYVFFPESILDLEAILKFDATIEKNRFPVMATTVNQIPMYFFLHFLENNTIDYLPIWEVEETFQVFDPDWEGTYKLSIADFIFLVSIALSGLVAGGGFINCLITWSFKKNRWKKWRNEVKRQNKLQGSDTEEFPFVTRKVQMKGVSPRKMKKKRSASVEYTLSRRNSNSKSPKTPKKWTPKLVVKRKKRKAPQPPKTKSRVNKLEMKTYEVEVYKSPERKPNPTYYIVKNANLPASEGYSDISE